MESYSSTAKGMLYIVLIDFKFEKKKLLNEVLFIFCCWKILYAWLHVAELMRNIDVKLRVTLRQCNISLIILNIYKWGKSFSMDMLHANNLLFVWKFLLSIFYFNYNHLVLSYSTAYNQFYNIHVYIDSLYTDHFY